MLISLYIHSKLNPVPVGSVSASPYGNITISNYINIHFEIFFVLNNSSHTLNVTVANLIIDRIFFKSAVMYTEINAGLELAFLDSVLSVSGVFIILSFPVDI